MRVAVPFAKNVYVTILSRIHGKGVAITEKGITLVISIQDMDDINWIIKSLEKLINGVSEIVKHKIKRQKEGFFGMLLGTLGIWMFFRIFLVVMTKFSFWDEGWTLGNSSITFWDFGDIA